MGEKPIPEKAKLSKKEDLVKGFSRRKDPFSPGRNRCHEMLRAENSHFPRGTTSPGTKHLLFGADHGFFRG